MLKKLLTISLFILFFQINSTFANTLIEQTISGYKVKIIEYKTDSKLYDIKVGVHPKDGGSLREIIGTVNGITGVTGIFQCPKDYPACGGKNYTINERYVNGEKKATYKSTGDRVVFGWNKNIEPFLFQTDKINSGREKEIWEGFANHPLLLKDGIPQTEKYHELNLIDYKMKSRGTRNFICSNKTGKKIYFGLVYNINIDKLAIILKEFGCYNAINLDAGYSTAFIYNGKYLAGPGREILDGVFIVPKNIDVKKIEKKGKKIVNKIIFLLNKNIGQSKKKKISKIIQLYKNMKKYEKNIIKNNQYNIIKNGKNIGTKTEFKDKKELEKIFLLHTIKRYLNRVKINKEFTHFRLK